PDDGGDGLNIWWRCGCGCWSKTREFSGAKDDGGGAVVVMMGVGWR
nr:hypothetical protein [Tanacetum cinerariifolium]